MFRGETSCSSSSMYPRSYSQLICHINTLERDYMQARNPDSNPKRLSLIAFINSIKDVLENSSDPSQKDYEKIQKINTRILLGSMIYAANVIQREYTTSTWNRFLSWLKELQPEDSKLYSMLEGEFSHLNKSEQAKCLCSLDDFLQNRENTIQLNLGEEEKEDALSNVQCFTRNLSGPKI